jgi:hypothetical protein
MLTRLILTALAVVILALPTAVPAADWRDDGAKALVLTYKVAPGARPSFRAAARAHLLPDLARLKAAGRLADYHVLASRYVDDGSWDLMMILDFKQSRDLVRWRDTEAAHPAGLDAASLKSVRAVESAPADLMRAGPAPGPAKPPVYLVVPYAVTASTDDYLAYADGYILPQLKGWIEAKALSTYGLYLARYPAGRPWTALLVLAYRGDDGLARRDAVVKQVRAALAADPAWKTFSDTKTVLRTEGRAVVADDLAPMGSAIR